MSHVSKQLSRKLLRCNSNKQVQGINQDIPPTERSDQPYQLMLAGFSSSVSPSTKWDDVVRIMNQRFLWRKHSLSSLLISRELLLKLLRQHEIGPCFLDLLFAFQPLPGLNSCWSSVKAGESVYGRYMRLGLSISIFLRHCRALLSVSIHGEEQPQARDALV